MEVTYIYELRDPFTLERRYIGKTKNPSRRYAAHLMPHYLRAETYKNRWLRKVLAAGGRPLMIILCECAPWEDANQIERDFIRRLSGASRLTNGTKGGDGGDTSSGRKFPSRGRPSPMRGVKWPADDPRREGIRARQLGKIPTQATSRALVVNTKMWAATSPSGDRFEFLGLGDFCAERGLSASKMAAVAKGAEGRTNHKGWRCEKL